VSGVALLPLSAYFGRLHFLLQVKSAQKKPLPVNVSKLAAWVCGWLAVGLQIAAEPTRKTTASFCGKLRFKKQG